MMRSLDSCDGSVPTPCVRLSPPKLTTNDARIGLPGDRSEAWVKTFERVDGATVEGNGPANAEVEASVQMEMSSGETFVYRQFVRTDENGDFEMTVPYSTTGYDEYGPENGHTNVSVRAATEYQFVAVTNGTGFVGTADVTEGQVIGEDDTPVQVELEASQGQETQESQDTQDDGSTDGGSTDGDSTNETTDQQRRAPARP